MNMIPSARARQLISSFVLVAIAIATGTGSAFSKIQEPAQLLDTTTRQVYINEVAWGGTAANGSHVWVELYNNTGTTFTLTNWQLIRKKGTSTKTITISGTISPFDYFLIESSESATSISSDHVPVDMFSLEGDDIILELRQVTGSVNLLMDTANKNEGPWPAGEAVGSHCSMERIHGYTEEVDTAWVTSTYVDGSVTDADDNSICGTPGQQNSTPDVTPTVTPTADPNSTPTPTRLPVRSVVINEVAWMGTLGDGFTHSDDEWIELYNPTSNDINLSGWTIKAYPTTGTVPRSDFYIELTGVIKANSFYLLERGEEIVISNIEANQIYGKTSPYLNQMNNTVDWIKLADRQGFIIDTANLGGSQWFAGNASTACSMERLRADASDTASNWLTYAKGKYNGLSRDNINICGSPGIKNWAYEVTPTPTLAPSVTPTVTPTGYLPSSIVLNEFLVQPVYDHNGDGLINSGDSYIELANLGNSSISLKGWRLDDQPNDSSPYIIGDVMIEGKGKAVFFFKDTGILLSTGSDSVRLLKNSYTYVDVYSYPFDARKGISWCRFEDGWGGWISECIPTPKQKNQIEEISVSEIESDPACLFEFLPEWFRSAACSDANFAKPQAISNDWLQLIPLRKMINGSEFWIQ